MLELEYMLTACRSTVFATVKVAVFIPHEPCISFPARLMVRIYGELFRNGLAVHHYVVVAIALTLTDHVL